MAPLGPDDPPTVADFLPSVKKDKAHGESFAYREPNIFVLGWIVRRAADQDLATLASEMVWQHIGAEHDWLYMVDAGGAEPQPRPRCATSFASASSTPTAGS